MYDISGRSLNPFLKSMKFQEVNKNNIVTKIFLLSLTATVKSRDAVYPKI